MNDPLIAAAAEIERQRPDLMGFFRDASEILLGFVSPDESLAASLRDLTLASESLYIDIYLLLPRAAARDEVAVLSRVLYRMTRCGPEYGQVLLTAYPDLGYPLSAIAEPLVGLAESCAQRLARGHQVVAFCLGFREEDAAQQVLGSFLQISIRSPGAVLEIVEQVSDRLVSVDRAVFLDWISRGSSLIGSGRVDQGIAFFMLRSRESRQLFGLRHVVLDDLRNVLRIYCTSLAGRELRIVDLGASAYAMATPYTDGQSVFLPAQIDYFTKPAYNERVYTVMAAHQAAQVGMGTFDLRLAALDFEDELHDRYGTALPEIMDNVRRQYRGTTVRERSFGDVEVVFENGRQLTVLNSEHEKFFYSFPTPDLVRSLFTLLENARVEFLLARLYPGLAQDFAVLNRYVWETRQELVDSPEADLDERLLTLLEALVQYSLVGQWRGDLEDEGLLTRIASATTILDGLRRPEATVDDTARSVFQLYNLLFDFFQLIPFCRNNDVRESFDGLARPDIHPEVILEVSPELMASPVTGPRASHTEGQEISSAPETRDIDLTSLGTDDREGRSLQRDIARGSVRLFRYPEFDHRLGGYRERHCTLFERVLPSRKGDFYQAALAGHRRVWQRIRKRFLAMQPEEVVVERRWLSGDEIHLADAVDYATDLLRGATPNEKIYQRKIMNRRDVAAAILIDASSSTDELVGGTPIIDLEKTALSLLASVLSMIGDTFGLFAFNSMGPARVFYDVIKDYEEDWNSRGQGRIQSVRAWASNRDGCAIRHTIARLAALPQKTKLLLLLSDGIPADVDYGSDSSSDTSTYSIEDTRRAILECRLAGIVPYCLTVDRFARSYIPRLYGEYHYAILNDLQLLPEKLSRLYMRLTR